MENFEYFVAGENTHEYHLNASREVNAHLTSIVNQEESVFVRNLVIAVDSNTSNKYAFIGLLPALWWDWESEFGSGERLVVIQMLICIDGYGMMEHLMNLIKVITPIGIIWPIQMGTLIIIQKIFLMMTSIVEVLVSRCRMTELACIADQQIQNGFTSRTSSYPKSYI